MAASDRNTSPRAGIREDGEGKYRVNGELDMHSVAGVLHAAADILSRASSELVFDLSEVSRSDSAGLALLIEWQQQAETRNIPLKFVNLPAQMRAIADASGLEEVLMFAD